VALISLQKASKAKAPESALFSPSFSPRSVAAAVAVPIWLRESFFGELTMGYKVAVVGATGNVGRAILEILAERSFPADEVIALASRKSQGIEVSYGNATLKCKALEHYDFSDVDICLMSAGSAVSKEWSPKIAAKGAVVIDNSSCWRY